MFYQRMKAQQEELGKPAQAQKKPDLFTSEKHLQEELDKLDHEEEEVTLPMDEIVKSQKRLNSKFLLDKSGCDSLGDIKQVFEEFRCSLIKRLAYITSGESLSF